MRRASLLLRGETRPQKRICFPQTRFPHSDLSHPPLEVWCAEGVQHHISSVWQLGDALGLPPLPSVLLAPADHVLGDTIGSLLQRMDPAPAIFQSSASLSIIPNKYARGFPSWWRASPLPGLLDTPSQVCLPQHDTPLSHFVHEWEHLPGESLWVLRTVRSGYTLQFGRNPPRFDGVQLTVVNSDSKASVLRQELSSLLQKGAIEEVPQSDIEQGFFQPLLPCTKKGRRPETHSVSASPEPFPLQREVQDADDEDNHVSDSRRGLVCHYRPKGCIFSHPIQGPSLRPGLGTENVHEVHGYCTGPLEVPRHSCAELLGRLAHSGPLQGVSESSQRYRSLPHSFSWPQNERQEECSLPLSANCIFGGSLGLHSDAGPFGSCPDFQFYSMPARFKLGHHVSVSTCRSLLGLMAATSPVLPLGLLHMRLFLWWMKGLRLHPTIPATRLIRVSRSCFRPLLQWRDPAFLQSGVRMGAIHRCHMIRTDASMTGWGAVFEGRPARREWTGEFLSWHINCLELRAVFLASMHFLPALGKHHIIVRTDNMAVVSHINRQGGSRSRTLDRLARRLLL